MQAIVLLHRKDAKQMSEQTLLSKVESALSNAWGGSVQLSFKQRIEEHPHVARLTVQKAPASAPKNVMLKRSRGEGEERFSPEFSAGHFFNEWVNMEFMSTLLGDQSPAAQIYAGDQTEVFFVTEDLGDNVPLKQALWGGDASKATQVLIHYGELLGRLHGETASHFDDYTHIQHRLNPNYALPTENYLDYFRNPVRKLESLGIELPPSALDDIHEAAGKLSQPNSFSAFTHGDPVFSNIIDWQGRWRFIDFEAARFRNALLEGIYPRMFFPTSGLRDVLRIPEAVWRQSESAYRTVLSQYLPVASDDALYGSALTAACAFWVLTFCETWLERAIVGNVPPEMLNRIRQCAIARFEIWVTTSQEFQSLTSLGDFFEGLAAKFRAQWPGDACNLPLYPAFSEPVGGLAAALTPRQ
jgi:tRNA A-37 threonylcarbamoyl transferase component Bud32